MDSTACTASLARFSNELIKFVLSSQQNDNVLVSPIGLATALAMLCNGTSGNTDRQLRNVLHLPSRMRPEDINDFYDSLMDTYNWERHSAKSEATSHPTNFRKTAEDEFDRGDHEESVEDERTQVKSLFVASSSKASANSASSNRKRDVYKPVKRTFDASKKRSKTGLFARLRKLLPDSQRVRVTKYSPLEAASSCNVTGNNLKIDKGNEYEIDRMRGREVLISNLTLISKLYDVLPKFADVLFEKYQSIIIEVDFMRFPHEVTDEVSEWIVQSTKGLISHFDQPLSKTSSLVVLNCVYFNALWQEPFGTPYEQEFHVNSNQSKEVMFMDVLKVFKYLQIPLEVSENFFQLIEIPFEGTLSMIILLPPKKSALDSFSRQLSIEHLMTHFTASGYFRSIHLRMPKFNIALTKNMSGILKKMNLTDIFHSQLAHLNGLTCSPDLYVSEIKQITVINVNEAGVGSESPTFNQDVLTCGFFDPLELAIDRPFLFFIHDSLPNLTLFVGKIEDPTVSA